MACASESPTDVASLRADVAPAQGVGKVDVCHRPDDGGAILQVGAPALGAHLAHGDYVTTLLVSHDGATTGDGVHFGRITDALAAARAGRLARGETLSAACRITIDVAAGVYPGIAAAPATGSTEQLPLIVDVPDITLRGALAMELNESGRATGASTTGDESTISPVEPLPIIADIVSTPIIAVDAHPGGSAGNGLTVQGFVFLSGHDPAVDSGGQAVLSARAERVTIRGNRFEGGFTEKIDVRSGSVELLENYAEGNGVTCDFCLAGPGRFRAVGNTIVGGGIPGIGISGVVGIPMPDGIEPLTLPTAAESWAEFRNNEVRDHLKKPVGVGVRVDAVGVLAPNVHNTIHAVIQNNLLVNNRFGVIVHAAFPRPGTLLRADVDVAMGGNQILQSCQARLLVAFSRHTTVMGVSGTVAQPYLQNSTFQLSLGGNLDWSDVWFGHPDGFGNTLIVDGQTIPNGFNTFYDDVGCPGD
jgi:hypothetical protein